MRNSETVLLAGNRKKSIYENTLNEQAVRALINRVVFDGFDENFLFSKLETDLFDCFILSSKDGKIKISANNTNTACSAVNHYLKHFLNCNISPITRNIPVTRETRVILPENEVRVESPFLYRYLLNYCTFSYTMAFWDFNDFEYLIDYMALSGINLALNIVGYECVIKKLLEVYGYSEEEIGEYICGSGYFAWQWMHNLMGFCGPLPSWWYQEREALAQKINRRFLDLGIEVMLPAFFGSVPQSFKEKYAADIVSQGKWCISYDRPDLILPADPLFRPMSEDYYRILEKVMGFKPSYFSVDPFHEGGNEDGIDKKALTGKIYEAMQQYNPNAVWVFQGWILNPRREMLLALDKQNVLITDLVADISPCFKGEGDDFLHYPYVLCQVNNYGGQRNHRGNFLRSMNTPYEALDSDKAQGMCGIGLLMEGIEDVELFYDLLGDLSFCYDKPDADSWLRQYIKRRYNTDSENVFESLKLLAEKVLICTEKEGTRESIFIARPAVDVKKVSMWTAEYCAYDEKDLWLSLKLLFSQYDSLAENGCYQFDITDLARQALSNYGWVVLGRIMNGENVQENQKLFLDMILMQDALMSSIKRTCLSSWTDKAEALGKNEAETDLFRKNARYLISFWSDPVSAAELHDYASKEWGGLLKGYHYKRWETFFNLLNSRQNTESFDWYNYEKEIFADQKLPLEEVPCMDKKALISDIIMLAGEKFENKFSN